MIASYRWIVVCGLVACGGGGEGDGESEDDAHDSDTGAQDDDDDGDDHPSSDADTSGPRGSSDTTSDAPDGSDDTVDPSSSTGPGACDPPDADGDGHAAIACGGLDCDDGDPLVHPDAIEFDPAVETVVPDIASGSMTLVGADDDGVVYVAHEYASYTYLADDASGAWLDERVGDGQGFDIHIDPDGNLRVAFVIGMGSNTLVYSPSPGMIEYPPDGPSGADVAGSHFMDVDGLGRTHLVWRPVPGEGVRWAVRDDEGEWLSETVQDEPAFGASIAVSDEGQPWVLYDAESPTVATRVDDVWELEPLDVATLAYAAVDVDADGHVHVAIGDYTPTLTYLTNASGAWVQEEIGSFGFTFYETLAVGPDGAIYIAAENHSRLYVAGLDLLTNASGEWRQETLRSDASSMLPGIGFVGDELLVSHVVPAQEVALVRARLPDGVDDDCDGDVW